jgi:hypothetical protein
MTFPELAQEDDQDASEPGVGFGELREGRCKSPLGAIDLPPTRFCSDATLIIRR